MPVLIGRKAKIGSPASEIRYSERRQGVWPADPPDHQKALTNRRKSSSHLDRKPQKKLEECRSPCSKTISIHVVFEHDDRNP